MVKIVFYSDRKSKITNPTPFSWDIEWFIDIKTIISVKYFKHSDTKKRI